MEVQMEQQNLPLQEQELSQEETTTSKEFIVPPAEERLHSGLNSMLMAIEPFNKLVDGMTKNELGRVMKAIFAYPLEHEQIKFIGKSEEYAFQMFIQKDADKFNMLLAQMEIDQKERLLTQEGETNG